MQGRNCANDVARIGSTEDTGLRPFRKNRVHDCFLRVLLCTSTGFGLESHVLFSITRSNIQKLPAQLPTRMKSPVSTPSRNYEAQVEPLAPPSHSPSSTTKGGHSIRLRSASYRKMPFTFGVGLRPCRSPEWRRECVLSMSWWSP